jgi:chromosome segregation ATPase
LTPFAAAGYPRFRTGGGPIPELAHQPASVLSDGVSAEVAEDREASELERLQHAVLELVARHRALRAENEALRARLDEREERIRELQERRQDAIRRIDSLVAQVDELDARIEASEAAS